MKIFSNMEAVLTTKHKKEKVIEPLMVQSTGCRFMTHRDFNTDSLGTFTLDIPREMSQLDAAYHKAQIGIQTFNCAIGIGSEGTFGFIPFVGTPWNIETVALINTVDNFKIHGTYKGYETNYRHGHADSLQEAVNFCDTTGFPDHYIILRPDSIKNQRMFKDITHYEQLEKDFTECFSMSETGTVSLETDMRAHANPTRMTTIRKATEDLVSKLLSLCPACGTYGYVITESLSGLPCALCSLPTKRILKHVKVCRVCKGMEEILYPDGALCPARECDFCNP